MLRSVIFRLIYWKNKLTMRNIKMKGYCVIFPFPNCGIKFVGGGDDKLFIYK
jgi:hypothetical protein